MAFLFGEVPHDIDLTDSDARAELFGAGGDLSPVQVAARQAVANQVLEDNPPEVWTNAARLLDAGLDRHDVLRQIMLTFAPQLLAALHDEEPFDPEAYAAALGRLPLPDVGELRAAIVDLAARKPGISFLDLGAKAAAQLGARGDDPGVEALTDRLLDELVDDDGPLLLLADDVVVHVETVIARLVLTHRLTAQEHQDDVLPVDVDLAGYRRADGLSTPDGAPIDVSLDRWYGPAGWLAAYSPGTLLAVTVRGGAVQLTAVDAPAVDPALVHLLRGAYDSAVAEPWLPVEAEELVLAAAAGDPTAFTTPAAPVDDLLAAAGLEVRGSEVAHEASVWAQARQVQAIHRVHARLGDDDQTMVALTLLEDLAGELDTTTARDALDRLDDLDLLEVVMDELLDLGDLPATAALVGRLSAAASRPAQRAVAGWMACIVAERRGGLAEAEEHLRTAVRADPLWPAAVDRLAWYRSDRGDADGALQLWRSLGVSAEESDDVRTLEELPSAVTAQPGRNEPCWCGSGRKFKQCHVGRPAPVPLPDRVGWLCRKPVAFLERRGGEARDAVLDHVTARLVNPDEDSVREAVQDPLTLDVALHESGWFDRFLDERGALLPDDEALLLRAWTLVERTVYEVVHTRPGEGVTVKDLRTGDAVEVRERTFSRSARLGARICARAVPDGFTHQFIGGMFSVPPGRETELLALLDDGDGQDLLSYVAALHRRVVIGPDGQVLDLPKHLPKSLPAGSAPVQLPAEVVTELVEGMEQRWCTEPVPALGGVTPEQAAADPTRRDDLVRLIDSFPEIDPATGAFGLRPVALRARLGLPPRHPLISTPRVRPT